MDREAVGGRGRALTRYPPGPARSLGSLIVYGPGRDPLAFFSRLAREHGDLVHVHLAGEHVVLVNDPGHVRDILVTHQRAFHKGRGLERARRLLGQGLLTSEDALHVRQRRLMQPAFHRDRIAAYAGIMTEYADRIQEGWTDGVRIDVAREMTRLTLGIVGKTLFDADVESQAREVGEALTAVLDSFWITMLPFADVLERLPIPVLRRSRRARERLDGIIYGMIAERRRDLRDRGDLLSMLLLAQDDEAEAEATGAVRMSDEQVRDEAMTIFLAGHETTAVALAWTWHLVGGAPDVERKLHAEVDRVLHGRRPTIDDIPALPYLTQVATESMRLYPPAWIVGRRAVEDYPIDGYVLPARTVVLFSPYLLHRDARRFPDPDRFLPERWTPEFKAALPPFAYVPFGGGARRCIGESFAWMELVLAIASIARRWRLEAVPGHPVVPQPLVTLRLKHGLQMTPRRR
jgi:cytochrome P450